MKQNIIKGMALGCAMMLGAASLSAAIPEHLYMVGEASPSLWYFDIAQEMTNEGDGVFSYRGTLYKQNLQFIDAKNGETGVRYVPEVSGWHITEAATATIVSGIGNENRFWVPENGTYEIKVYFGDDGDSVYITGQWVDEMAPMVIPMGASTNQWDTATAHPSYNIYPQEGTTDIFVWEGKLDPNPACKHFKFIAFPSNYWETWFYVPAECDHNEDAGNDPNVKLVKAGETYPVRRVWGSSEGIANDHFWGFPAEACTPDKKYRVTLNLDDDIIKFEEVADDSGVSEIDGTELKARFVGNDLIVEGASADIEVYDMSGRKVAHGNNGSLTVAGLSNGVYVVKALGSAIKIVK